MGRWLGMGFGCATQFCCDDFVYIVSFGTGDTQAY